MKRNHLFAPLTLISAACALAADNTADEKRAESPVLAYRYSAEAKELRALLGVPGSSRWSDAIEGLPEGITAMRIAPGHRWALVSRTVGDDATMETGVLTLDNNSYTRLGGAMSLDKAVFSPSGSAVVIAGDAGAIVYSGLPGAPSEAKETPLSEGAFAVSDSGTVASLASGRIVRGADALMECAECLFTFQPGSSDALTVMSGTGDLSEYGTELRSIAVELQPASMLTVTETGAIILGNADRLRVLDRETGALLREETVVGASRLEPLRHNGAMLIAIEEGGASWMLAADGVKVIPAAATKVQE